MVNRNSFANYNLTSRNAANIVLSDLDVISPDTASGLHYEMVRLRRSQEDLMREYHPADEMRCPVHFCIGQEAMPAALALLLKPEDYLFSHHRSHGYYIAKVHSLNRLFAEIYGKENGANKGRAGSQDISMSDARFYSGAILAGTAPIAAGAAMALQMQNAPFIAVTATGDGATDEGVYWETLNYAGLKKLPILFVCENNYYSTYSPQHDRNATLNLSERVGTFGVETRAFFGNDVVNVYCEVKKAIEDIRAGKGPIFLESFTYRWNAHVGPEDDDYNEYRTRAEIEYWKNLCPIKLLEQRLLSARRLSEDQRAAIYTRAESEVAAAFRFAKEGPFTKNASWDQFNRCPETPLADKLLVNERDLNFQSGQAEALPGPY